ncbi:Uncharacterized conserved protein YdeI, YjbR/CyaY-like superfamily, DUF1801 family [Parapedobacter composti]|uniref:Uncharacterized conserved protein YdeI, YjbR/CyaY-like superfamily, DUF1801 family n=1 Tax=Parapedobacter composti TaxID=623281 RepID=A0A1I1FYI7_9SPHI|nr:YdeI/OmpD-associated family protein [Parapedobacter composti]SFC04082.1 Uncharacterized conserved protein YdeI, YjbR/CyaY-like superfamily, DUF1801 family [Parapedobacter composti]
MKDHEKLYAATREEWRRWLSENHREKQGVWLVTYSKKSGKPTLTWSEAVDEALCFGWIDSIKKKLDEERAMQFFGKRKPTSTWSKINKEKVSRLIEEGRMTPAGLACVEVAQQNGCWTILDEVEALTIPEDLEAAFLLHDGAKNYFDSLSRSARKAILTWVVLAKRPDTRQKRVNEIAVLAAQNKKPKQF